MRKIKPVPRDRENPLRIYVNQSERDRIGQMARASGMTVSAYVRAVACGHQPRAVPPNDVIENLARANVIAGLLASASNGHMTQKANLLRGILADLAKAMTRK